MLVLLLLVVAGLLATVLLQNKVSHRRLCDVTNQHKLRIAQLEKEVYRCKTQLHPEVEEKIRNNISLADQNIVIEQLYCIAYAYPPEKRACVFEQLSEQDKVMIVDYREGYLEGWKTQILSSPIREYISMLWWGNAVAVAKDSGDIVMDELFFDNVIIPNVTKKQKIINSRSINTSISYSTFGLRGKSNSYLFGTNAGKTQANRLWQAIKGEIEKIRELYVDSDKVRLANQQGFTVNEMQDRIMQCRNICAMFHLQHILLKNPCDCPDLPLSLPVHRMSDDVPVHRMTDDRKTEEETAKPEQK